MGIVRPVMAQYPYAWLFFIPFILIATFTMLNLFIGIIVDSMQRMHDAEQEHVDETVHDDSARVIAEIRALHAEVRELRQALGGAAPAGQTLSGPDPGRGEHEVAYDKSTL